MQLEAEPPSPASGRGARVSPWYYFLSANGRGQGTHTSACWSGTGRKKGRLWLQSCTNSRQLQNGKAKLYLPAVVSSVVLVADLAEAESQCSLSTVGL